MTGSFTLYAFRHDTEPGDDLRRTRLPRSRIGQAADWAVAHGSQYVLIQHVADQEPFSELVVHHTCSYADCPGGCT